MEFGVITGHSYLVESFNVMCYIVKVKNGVLEVLRWFVMKMFVFQWLFFLLPWVLVLVILAILFEVKIKEVSTTKRTVVMDQGLLDGLTTGKKGWLFFSSSKKSSKCREKGSFW